MQHPDRSRVADESHVVKNRSQPKLDATLPAGLGSELFTEVRGAGAGLSLAWRAARETRSAGRPRLVMTRHIDPRLRFAGSVFAGGARSQGGRVDLGHGRPGHRGQAELPEGSIATTTPLEAASCP